MKITLATYEHSTIGFPHIKLKWTVEDGKVSGAARVVVKGVISQAPWTWHNVFPMPFIDYEIALFDAWVRSRFAGDVSVQG